MKVYAWSALVCALTVGVFCGKTDAADDAKLVARIGGKTLSVQEFEERAKELKQTGYNRVTEFDAEGKRTLLDGIIARELLIMEGRRRGYDQDSTIAATIEKSERKALMMELYEREAVQPSYALTEETLRAFFHEYQYDIEVLSQHIVCVVKSAQKKHYKNCAMGRFLNLSSVRIQRRISLPALARKVGWVGSRSAMC